MKRLIVAVVAVGILVGLGFHLNRYRTEPAPPAGPVAEATPGSADTGPEAVEPAPPRPEQATQRVEIPPVAKPISRPVAAPGNPELDAAFLQRTVDLLVSPQVGYQQKREA